MFPGDSSTDSIFFVRIILEPHSCKISSHFRSRLNQIRCPLTFEFAKFQSKQPVRISQILQSTDPRKALAVRGVGEAVHG